MKKATTATATAQSVQPTTKKAEVKNMKEKNTKLGITVDPTNKDTLIAVPMTKAPETTATQKPEEKKQKRSNGKSQSQSQTKNTATKDEKKKGFTVAEDGKSGTIVIFSAPITKYTAPDGTEAFTHDVTIKTTAVALPKTIKGVTEGKALMKLIQGKVAELQLQDIASKLADVIKAEKDGKTSRTKEQREALKDQKKAIENTLKKNGIDSTTTTEPIAELYSCYIMGRNLPINTALMRAYLKTNYTALHNANVKLVSGQSVKLTNEELESFKGFKACLVDTLKAYTAESAHMNAFKLSVSNADAVTYYERSTRGIDPKTLEPLFIWDTKKGKNGNTEDVKELHKTLMLWLFGKMKAEAETTEA